MMKARYVLLWGTLLLAIHSTAQQSVNAYLEQYYRIAITEMERTGVPASVLLAAGIKVSNIGSSKLATEGYNHFGLKCEVQSGWSGARLYNYDEDGNGPICYRTYRTANESYLDFANFLVNEPATRDLLDASNTNYKDWFGVMASLEVALPLQDTDGLTRLVEGYSIDIYDYQDFKSGAGMGVQSVKRRIGLFNGLKGLKVVEGETPFVIADALSITHNRILRYNDLEAGDGFKPGQIVYLEPKKSAADIGIAYYELKTDTDLYDVSQNFGVRLKKLAALNDVEPEARLASGERVYLSAKAPTRPKLAREATKVVIAGEIKIDAIDAPLVPDATGGDGVTAEFKPNFPSVVLSPDEGAAFAPPRPDVVPGRMIVNDDEPMLPPGAKPQSPLPADLPVQQRITDVPGRSNSPDGPTGSGLVNTVDEAEPTNSNIVPFQFGDDRPSNFNSSSAAPRPAFKPSAPRPVREGYYIVKAGDTLYSIARTHKTTVEALKEWNNLKDGHIEPGQELMTTYVRD